MLIGSIGCGSVPSHGVEARVEDTRPVASPRGCIPIGHPRLRNPSRHAPRIPSNDRPVIPGVAEVLLTSIAIDERYVEDELQRLPGTAQGLQRHLRPPSVHPVDRWGRRAGARHRLRGQVRRPVQPPLLPLLRPPFPSPRYTCTLHRCSPLRSKTLVVSFLFHVLYAAAFRSLLYEACGRTINPVNGATGLLWTGNWHLCQAAADTVLGGGTIRPLLDLGGDADVEELYRFQKAGASSSSSSPPRKMPKDPESKVPPKFDLDLCLMPSSPEAQGQGNWRASTPSATSESSVTTTNEGSAGDQTAEEKPTLLNLFV
ncbi:hypothetical protein B296_00025566 [Ensete ventricosum]|uniref:LOB domain-containing protein n=1 Tax=Ensete ventricosum TaxID=4639 RepID=A0A427ARL8_ENSVE|nr:hypothetical protein B296_00025566 [Ensete ventricosum]